MLAAVMFVWGIVKIIGLILLVILGLLFLLLALVLLVPLRYQVEGSYYKTPRGTAKITWFFHVLAVKAAYEEKLTLAVRVLGFKVFGKEMVFGESKEEDEHKEDQEALKAEKDYLSEEETFSESGKTSKAGEASEERELSEEKEALKKTKISKTEEALKDREIPQQEEFSKEQEISKEKESLQAREFSSGRKNRKKNKKRKRSRGFSISRICDKLKEKTDRIKHEFRSLKKKKKKIAKFLCDEKNHRTFRLLLRQLKRLVCHVLPRKAAGRVKFGFDDPYTTGQVLTYVSPFYGLYGGQVELIPVFEEPVLEGEGKIKGLVRAGTVLFLAVRMLFDKNFRTLLKKCLKA